MKKFFAILASVALSLGFLAGCSEEDELGAPTETWVEKDYSYTDDNGKTSQLTCYFMFTESGYSNSSLKNVPENSQNGSSTTIKPGLTVVIVPSASADTSVTGTIISELADNKFICKTFGMGSNDESGYSFEMTYAKWNVFYYANISAFLSNDQLKNPPTPLKTTGYTELTDFSNFSWKRLLANYLLGSL